MKPGCPVTDNSSDMNDIYIAFAPMEGIVTATYRRVFRRYFAGIDRFYTPFLAVNKNHKFRHREISEYTPFDSCLVPQLITASSVDFLWGVQTLADAGYREVNLNLGCPSSTVVTKHKGAGMLEDKDRLDEFFYQIFDTGNNLPAISLKTRIGMRSHEEIYDLIDIWAKYPFSEIIIHPRAGVDMYEGSPDIEAFKAVYGAFENSDTLITYNGDIRSAGDILRLQSYIPGLTRFMIGRGLLIDPKLATDIHWEPTVRSDASPETAAEAQMVSSEGINTGETGPDPRILLEFLSELWIEYANVLSGERDILFKMKELWFWLGQSFPDHEKELKSIRKCTGRNEYKQAVSGILM